MKAQLLLLAAGLAGGMGIGWLTAPTPTPVEREAARVPAIIHGGRDAQTARQALAELGLAPPPETAYEPPPPDIAVLFRRDLTAIEERAGRRVVWIVDYAQTYRRRALRVGDVYQDGWRISRIGAQRVELRRRREVRAIDAFALAPAAP